MKCKDIMTINPRCCHPSAPVTEAVRIMKEEDVGVVPIVEGDESKRLVGIVTDRDICLYLGLEDKLPSAVYAQDCMTKSVFTCSEDDDLEKAMNIMEDHQIRRVPIINRRGELVGIIATADIASSSASKEDKAEVLEDISQPAVRR